MDITTLEEIYQPRNFNTLYKENIRSGNTMIQCVAFWITVEKSHLPPRAK